MPQDASQDPTQLSGLATSTFTHRAILLAVEVFLNRSTEVPIEGSYPLIAPAPPWHRFRNSVEVGGRCSPLGYLARGQLEDEFLQLLCLQCADSAVSQLSQSHCTYGCFPGHPIVPSIARAQLQRQTWHPWDGSRGLEVPKSYLGQLAGDLGLWQCSLSWSEYQNHHRDTEILCSTQIPRSVPDPPS